MNLAHAHLILNHVPTVGFGVGLGLLVVGLMGKQHDDWKRASLVVIFFAAVLTIPAFLTGSATEFILRGDTHFPPAFPPGVSVGAIRSHEDAALLAMVAMEITGLFAWLALWQWRKTDRLAGWNMAVVTILALITFGLMAQTATLGGQISHPELREAVQTSASAAGTPATPAVAPPVEWPGPGVTRSLGLWVTGQTWVWPTSETLHFVGLCLLFTVVLLVDLRTLGVAKSIPLSAVYQLLPVGMLGFGLNLITGMLFFIGAPTQYIANIVFIWKFVLVVLAAANDLYFMLSNKAWAVGSGQDAPFVAKCAAASGIVLWIGVLYCGHMLPFIGNAF